MTYLRGLEAASEFGVLGSVTEQSIVSYGKQVGSWEGFSACAPIACSQTDGSVTRLMNDGHKLTQWKRDLLRR